MIYELLYIVPATKTDEEVATVHKSVTALVTKYGTETKRDELLGKIKLAYPINHIRYGHYLMAYFEAKPDQVHALDEELRHSPDVLRHVICRLAHGVKKGPITLTEYEVPDAFAKRKPRRVVHPVAPIATAKPQVDAKPMTDQELDETLEKILSADADTL